MLSAEHNNGSLLLSTYTTALTAAEDNVGKAGRHLRDGCLRRV